MVKCLCVLLASTMVSPVLVHGGQIRLSFLEEKHALDVTLQLLTNRFCSEEIAAAYAKVVRSYVFDKSEFNFSRFPAPSQGFYTFASIRELAEALPGDAFDCSRPGGFNCFDAVALLANGELRSQSRPTDLNGPYLVPKFTTNSSGSVVIMVPRETPRDAFEELYPPHMREASDPFFPASVRDSRICLTAALNRCHVLPSSTSGTAYDTNTLEVLRAAWKRDGIRFPDRFQIVLVHGTRGLEVTSEHAGLLFAHPNSYTYLEKLGARGPFVRLDFDKIEELLIWLSVLWDKCKAHDIHSVTFNEREIKRLATIVHR